MTEFPWTSLGTSKRQIQARMTCGPRLCSRALIRFSSEISPIGARKGRRLTPEGPIHESAAHPQFLHRPRWPLTKWDGLGTSNALHPPILAEESNFGTYLRF